MLKDTRSTEDARARYLKSATYARRMSRRRKNDAGEGPGNVPKAFGLATAVFAAIAKYGVLRRCQLDEIVTPKLLAKIEEEHDLAGLTVQWTIKGGRQGKQTFGIALNPLMPFIDDVRSVLVTLAETYDLTVDSEILPEERVIPDELKRTVDPDALFGSRARTRVLLALEVLGGEARWTRMCRSSGYEPTTGAEFAAKTLVRDGVIENDVGAVRFVDSGWIEPLRRVLRSMLDAHPNLRSDILARSRAEDERIARNEQSNVFGRDVNMRLLGALAANGPMRHAELREAIRVKVQDYKMKYLHTDGIIVWVRGNRRGKHPKNASIISLNRAHPIYEELKALVLAVSGLTERPGRPPDMDQPLSDYSVDYLFTKGIRLDALAMLAVCKNGEIDSASLERLCSRHDLMNIRNRLKDF